MDLAVFLGLVTFFFLPNPENAENNRPRSTLSFLLPRAVCVLNLLVLYQTGDFWPVSAPHWPRVDPDAAYRNRLAHARTVLRERVWGVESLAVHARTGRIFGSAKDGVIVELAYRDSEVELVARHEYHTLVDGAPCRPLGMRFSPLEADALYFVDAYHGVFHFDVVQERFSTILVNSSMPYLNDLDFLRNGDIVLSQPSIDYGDDQFHRIVLSGKAAGRLLLLNRTRNDITVLLEHLYTPNGVYVDRRSDIIYFAEMLAYRVQKLVQTQFDQRCNNLENVCTVTAEARNPQVTTLVDGLPGMPDNIRPSLDGRRLFVPLPEERMDLGWLEWPVIKRYMLAFYEVFLLSTKPETGHFANVVIVDLQTGDLLEAWNDPDRVSGIGGITQVLELGTRGFLLASDNAPALFFLPEAVN